jgi:succinoglycan biosynthesis transport protein ExoP
MLNQNSMGQPLPLGRAGKPMDLQSFAIRYGLLIVTVGAFIFSMLAPLAFLVSKPSYEVHGVLKIDPVTPLFITKFEDPSITNYYHEYARTQAMLMKEFQVLSETVNRLTPEEKAALQLAGLKPEACVAILMKKIKITPGSSTHLIELTASGANPQGLAPLLNRLMEVFLEKVRREAEMKDNDRLTYLTETRQALSDTISTMETQLKTLVDTVHTSSFSETFNVLQQKAQKLQELSVQSFGERVMAEREHQQSAKKAQALKALSLSPLVDEMVMKNQSLDFISSWTYQQLQQMRASLDGITKNNPDRVYVEQRMGAMRSYENQLRHEVHDKAKTIINGKRTYDLESELLSTQKKVETAKAAEQEVLTALATNQEQAAAISKGMLDGAALKQELDHNRDLKFRIDTRIHELIAEGKAPLRVSIESRARMPLAPTNSNTKKLLFLCFFAAFGLVGGGLLIYDFFDNRIRSSLSVEKALGHPPTWPISATPAEVPFYRLLTLSPNLQAAKAIRSLAVRLIREKTENGAKVFLFTGVERGAGCTGIILNCAQALTGLAPKVLVMEGNLENPELSRLSHTEGHQSSQGNALVGLTPDGQAVVHDPERGIDLLPAAKGTLDQPARRRLLEFIQQARTHYDAICIDSDAILKCDLTEYFAVQADVVVLISQGDSTNYRDLRRAAEILVRLEVPAIAPVLNWGGQKRDMWIDNKLAKLPITLEALKSLSLRFLRETRWQGLPIIGNWFSKKG